MIGPGYRRAPARCLGLGVAALAVGAAVYVAGRYGLPLPPGSGWRAWSAWWARVGPLVAVFATGRVVVMAAAGLMAVGFGVLAAVMAVPPWAEAVVRSLASWRVPGSRSLLRLAIGLGASAAALAACGSGSHLAAGTAPPRAPVLENIGMAAIPSAGPAPSVTHLSPAPAVPQLSPAPAVRAGPSAAPAVRAGPSSAVPGPAPQASPSPPAARWTVRSGDSLWSIAETEAGPRREHVTAYWLELIRLNRAHLPDPADPSLLFPGDVVILPARPTA